MGFRLQSVQLQNVFTEKWMDDNGNDGIVLQAKFEWVDVHSKFLHDLIGSVSALSW